MVFMDNRSFILSNKPILMELPEAFPRVRNCVRCGHKYMQTNPGHYHMEKDCKRILDYVSKIEERKKLREEKNKTATVA